MNHAISILFMRVNIFVPLLTLSGGSYNILNKYIMPVYSQSLITIECIYIYDISLVSLREILRTCFRHKEDSLLTALAGCTYIYTYSYLPITFVVLYSILFIE